MQKVKHKYDVKMLNFNVTGKCFEYDKYKSKRHIHNIDLSRIHYYFILFQVVALLMSPEAALGTKRTLLRYFPFIGFNPPKNKSFKSIENNCST